MFSWLIASFCLLCSSVSSAWWPFFSRYDNHLGTAGDEHQKRACDHDQECLADHQPSYLPTRVMGKVTTLTPTLILQSVKDYQMIDESVACFSTQNGTLAEAAALVETHSAHAAQLIRNLSSSSSGRLALVVRTGGTVELVAHFWAPLTNGRWAPYVGCHGDILARYYYDGDESQEALFAPDWPAEQDVVVVPRYASGVLHVRGRLNGDFASAKAGVALAVDGFESFDDFVIYGCQLVRNQTLGFAGLAGNASGDLLALSEGSSCEPSLGARAFEATGTRLKSLQQVTAVAKGRLAIRGYPLSAGWDDVAAADIWFVPSGLHWVWPTVRAGHETLTTIGDDPLLLVQVTTLSMQPGVFRIRGFLNAEEAQATVERNQPRIKPSEVGLVGRAGDKTRTSSNAWDTTSPGARLLIRRAFDLLKIDPDRKLEDGLQVLHYENKQWYKPHVDYFTARNGGGGGVDENAFSNANPQANNGTNRFATVFLYLSDSAEGGETVFPMSTTHEAYAGGRLTAAGTINTPGFIRNEDAAWVCNTSSDALRVTPRVAEAVLFYSQRGDGSLDPYSLHGSCPIAPGQNKWAANLWVWNRPRDAIDNAKAKARQDKDKLSQFSVTFQNGYPELTLTLHWENAGDLVKMGDIRPNEQLAMNTFPGHQFVLTSTQNHAQRLHSYTMRRGLTFISAQPPKADAKRSPRHLNGDFPAPPKIFDAGDVAK